MPENPAQVSHPLTSRNERKELLVLACTADRAAWCDACLSPPRSAGEEIVHHVLGYLKPVGGVLPGRLGRLIRGANAVAQFGRRLGWLRL